MDRICIISECARRADLDGRAYFCAHHRTPSARDIGHMRDRNAALETAVLDLVRACQSDDGSNASKDRLRAVMLEAIEIVKARTNA